MTAVRGTFRSAGMLLALAAALLLVSVALPSPAIADPAPTALSVLESLPVKGRAPMTWYDRAQFGSSWKDVDRNGCDTRNDVLRRDLVERVMGNRCTVLSGVLYPDPYTGRPLTFVRGRSVVDIDHVVALGNAWATGAQQLDFAVREQFANDPLNLLAVSASANRQKGDGDAATWLPSNKRYRCAYVARQVAVKKRYDLWVTTAERDAIRRILSACPDQRVPKDGTFTEPAPSTTGFVPPPPQSSMPTAAVAGDVVRYTNCTAARAAGVTPIRRVDSPALYAANSHMDRDRDGVACE